MTLEDLVSDALRMNPDRIIVGECRGPETMAMLWAFATGHAGMTSVHGESAEHALDNLARFALTSGARIEADQALDWLREIDLVVHCDRPRSFDTGERRFLPRRIDQIVEVAGIEGRRMTLNPLFNGAGSDLQWAATNPPSSPTSKPLASPRHNETAETPQRRSSWPWRSRAVAAVTKPPSPHAASRLPTHPATMPTVLEQAVRNALNMNHRLSRDVFRTNRVPRGYVHRRSGTRRAGYLGAARSQGVRVRPSPNTSAC